MCVSNRKVPTVVVTILSTVILLLSLVMIILSIRFNTKGITTNLGEFDEYANNAFLVLLFSSLIAMVSGLCGISLYCCKPRIFPVIFGCLMLPAATVVFLFGFSISTISNTSEETLH